MHRTLLLLISGLILFGLQGCGNRPKQAKPAKHPSVKTIRIGILPEQDVFDQKVRYQPLADYVGRKLGIRIKLVLLPHYGSLIDNFNTEQLDGAFFGSLSGAMALEKLHVVPLVRPESKDGTSTCYGIIFVRKDSGIRNGADMQGKRFVFVDKATTAGYLLPLHYFKEEGIADYHTWFNETYFAGTHEDAIYDVLKRKADIGAAKNTVFYRLAKTDRRLLEKLDILATSPKVPENCLALKHDFDRHYLTAFKDCLLKMDKSRQGRAVLDNFGAGRFIATTAADYQPVVDFAHHLGLDLTTYQYNNNLRASFQNQKH